MKKYKVKKWMVITVIATVLLTACGTEGNTDNSEAETEEITEGVAAASLITLSEDSEVEVDTEFTSNDLEVGYEESLAAYITLQDNGISIEGEGAAEADNVITVKDEGTYVISGTLNNGRIIVDAEDSDKVHLVLMGASITCNDNAPIYIKNADKVVITLEENTDNFLTDGSEYVQSDDENVDGVIFSKADLTLNGSGALTVTGNYKHGIVSKDDLVITGGVYTINAVKDGLNGKDCIKIKDGTFSINVSEGNGMQSKNSDNAAKGYIYICGGEIAITNCQEGIEATAIIIEDGIIDITAQDDGLNSASGNSSAETAADMNTEGKGLTATDDNTYEESEIININKTDGSEDTMAGDKMGRAPGQEGKAPNGDMQGGGFPGGGMQGGGGFENETNCYIAILGGTITIDASGDGIDSNGSLMIAGGSIYISGPTHNSDGGLDYNGTAEITGGTVVVTGSSGMAQGFSDTSTQYSILYYLDSACEGGAAVTLANENGNEIVSYTPAKAYQSVVISTEALTEGETYTLTCGEQSYEITLSSVVSGNGQQNKTGPAF